ncbi:hypothetical protein B296_00017969 [Ensete ventricosum]|uniref:Uncharacterized protein n=1 Tax=Ensete ventricosum TaxID=4639 RepID=A0A427ATR2_ENSVE|nr:hypothetical protein B296_00017969 [Ensete ventricosum]
MRVEGGSSDNDWRRWWSWWWQCEEEMETASCEVVKDAEAIILEVVKDAEGTMRDAYNRRGDRKEERSWLANVEVWQ